MPGAVGLNIVDSFAHLTPIITTDIGTHGPEICYLENGINGLMTDNRVEAYVSEIVRFIQHHNYQEKLREGCRRARAIYTIENMVERFAEGVYTALQGDSN